MNLTKEQAEALANRLHKATVAVRDYILIADWKDFAADNLKAISLEVNFAFANEHPGYQLIKREVSDAVLEAFPNLVTQAIGRVETRLETALRNIDAPAPAQVKSK